MISEGERRIESVKKKNKEIKTFLLVFHLVLDRNARNQSHKMAVICS